MAFEPLRTDEKLDKPIKKRPEFEMQMLSGCMVFGVMAFLTYALGIWPFLVIPELHLLRQIGIAAAAGGIPIVLLGSIAAFRGGLAPACGFLGGSLALSVFLYLLLGQIELGHTLPDMPKPDYPPIMTWWAPAAWTLTSVMITVIFGRLGEKRLEVRRQSSR